MVVQQPKVLQSQELAQSRYCCWKLSSPPQVTEHESGPQPMSMSEQLPDPVHETSHWPWPHMTVPPLQDPPLPHETVQSASAQLMVVF